MSFKRHLNKQTDVSRNSKERKVWYQFPAKHNEEISILKNKGGVCYINY